MDGSITCGELFPGDIVPPPLTVDRSLESRILSGDRGKGYSRQHAGGRKFPSATINFMIVLEPFTLLFESTIVKSLSQF